MGTPRAVEERLDRSLANNAWFNIFPSASLDNLVAPASDHYLILLNCRLVVRHQRAHCSFRYENAWQLEPGFDRLRFCADDLSSWSCNNCNKIRKDIAECQKQLEMQHDRHLGENQDQLVSLRKKMHQHLMQDDVYWLQCAKTF